MHPPTNVREAIRIAFNVLPNPDNAAVADYVERTWPQLFNSVKRTSFTVAASSIRGQLRQEKKRRNTATVAENQPNQQNGERTQKVESPSPSAHPLVRLKKDCDQAGVSPEDLLTQVNNLLRWADKYGGMAEFVEILSDLVKLRS